LARSKLTLPIIFLSLCVFCLCGYAENKKNCTNDLLGNQVCSRFGGDAVLTSNGVTCGIGHCKENLLGYVRCSKVQGGSITTNLNGETLCDGGCENPSPQYCTTLQLDKDN